MGSMEPINEERLRELQDRYPYVSHAEMNELFALVDAANQERAYAA